MKKLCRRGQLSHAQSRVAYLPLCVQKAEARITDDEIFVKEPKPRSGGHYVYFSAEMELFMRECQYITQAYGERKVTADDFLFRRQRRAARDAGGMKNRCKKRLTSLLRSAIISRGSKVAYYHQRR